MEETTKLALYNVTGGITAHVFNWLRSFRTERERVRVDIRRLEDRLNALTTELDTWKQKYYDLLKSTITTPTEIKKDA